MTKTPAEMAVLGGKARAKALSPDQKKEIATVAAMKRWGHDLPVATHKGVLQIGDIDIPCYVLKDGRRMLSQRGMMASIKMSRGGGKTSGDRLAAFARSKGVSTNVSNNLEVAIREPIRFFAPGGIVFGYEATALADLCDAVLAARKAGSLTAQQLHIADQCEVLVRGFARIGIISLVDEATGYQEIRDRKALAAILDRYLRKEHAAWAKCFPDDFYKELFRLRGWQWKDMNEGKKPQCVGVMTRDIVYERLAPGILSELEIKNPKNENGNRKAKHHQFLTPDVGHPALTQHVHAVMGFMRAADKWDAFKRLLDRAFPKKGETLLLPMDTGPGL